MLTAALEEQTKEQFDTRQTPMTAAMQQQMANNQLKYQQMQQAKANPNNLQQNQSAHFRQHTLVAPQPS